MRKLILLLWIAAASISTATAAPCAHPADLSPDEIVDGADLAILLTSWGESDGPADFTGDGFVDGADLAILLTAWGEAPNLCGDFPELWINGVNCATEPDIQIHQFNDDTYILRQSLCTNFEAPFIYLLFGEERVLMEDTGAGGVAIANAVYGAIDQWLIKNEKESIQLIVTHSHAHGDHVAGDSQFNGQPDTTVVGLSQSAVANFFGIVSWPTQIVSYDLGGRVLDVIPIPGHHTGHIAFYDRATGLLLTGDTIYPGRLYISSFSQYLASIQRLAAFVDVNPISWIVGTHIEMSNTPGQQFALGSTSHPNEHPLQLAPEILDELLTALIKMQASPHIKTHDEFVIWPF